MSESPNPQPATPPLNDVEHHLTYLKLPFITAQYAELAKQATQKS